MDNKIKIEYDGEYPHLCSGNLTVYVNGKDWNFPYSCLKSGGDVWFDENEYDHVEKGEWEISKWPENFPENLKQHVLYMINKEIPHGCCGGCI